MTEAEFQRLAAQGFNRVPLLAETFADLETPLSLYLKLANRSNTYLLESVVGGERFGRYSFIGLAAPVRLRAVGSLVTVMHGDVIVEKSQTADPLVFVREFLSRFRVAELPGLPGFCGGKPGSSATRKRERNSRTKTRGSAVWDFSTITSPCITVTKLPTARSLTGAASPMNE